MTEAKLAQYWRQVKQKGMHYLDYRLRNRASVWGNDPWLPSISCIACLAVLSCRHVSSLLEIGCGEGRDTVRFALEGIRITACDASAEGLGKGAQIAKQHGAEVSFIMLDYLEGDPIEETYDAIVALKFLHQVRRCEVNGLFDRINRNLRPGGCLLLSTFAADKDNNFEKGRLIEEDVWDIRGYRPIVFWRRGPLSDALHASGFDITGCFLLTYAEANHPEVGQGSNGSHVHAMWFVAAEKEAL